MLSRQGEYRSGDREDALCHDILGILLTRLVNVNLCILGSSYCTHGTMGASHKGLYKSQEQCRQLLGYTFLPESECSKNCVDAGDLTACAGDVDFR